MSVSWRLLLAPLVGFVVGFGVTTTASAAVFEAEANTPLVVSGNQTTASSLAVSGPGKITKVVARFDNLDSAYPIALDFLLESPSGKYVVLMSDSCGATAISDYDFVFDDAFTNVANSTQASCASIEQKPHNQGPGDYWSTAPGAVPGPLLSHFNGDNATGVWKLHVADSDFVEDTHQLDRWGLTITTEDPQPPIRGAKVLTPTDPTLRYKKSGKKEIKATGRVDLVGEALAAGECAGTVKSSFQTKVVKKKGKKKVTSYKQVKSVNSVLTEKAGRCGFDISAKLAKKYSGKKLRLVTNYLGGEYIAPFTRTTSERVKKLKF